MLQSIEAGDRDVTGKLLSLVYDELRRLAAAKLARERSDHTLQPTELVHEAFLRMVKAGGEPSWSSRAHFFAIAAEAMRRILIEHARSKGRIKRGGARQRESLENADLAAESWSEQLLQINDVLEQLAEVDSEAAQIVRLRYFVGLSVEEAAQAMGLSRATAYRHWTYARAWIRCELEDEGHSPS